MTERICLVGNSHLIMMQKAWAEQDPASDSVEAVFFGALIRHYCDLHRDAERSVLTFLGDLADFFKRSSGGLTEIDPADYDRFVLVGMRIGIINIYRALRNLVPSAHASKDSETRHILSDHLFEIWVREYFEASVGFSVLRELCAVTDKPIILVPQPHVADRFLTTKRAKHLPPAGDPLYAHVDCVFREAVCSAASALGAQVQFQRDSTLAGPGLSRSDYLDGAVKFSGRSFPDDDVDHMNAVLGRMFLEDLGMISPAT